MAKGKETAGVARAAFNFNCVPLGGILRKVPPRFGVAGSTVRRLCNNIISMFALPFWLGYVNQCSLAQHRQLRMLLNEFSTETPHSCF